MNDRCEYRNMSAEHVSDLWSARLRKPRVTLVIASQQHKADHDLQKIVERAHALRVFLLHFLWRYVYKLVMYLQAPFYDGVINRDTAELLGTMFPVMVRELDGITRSVAELEKEEFIAPRSTTPILKAWYVDFFGKRHEVNAARARGHARHVQCVEDSLEWLKRDLIDAMKMIQAPAVPAREHREYLLQPWTAGEIHKDLKQYFLETILSRDNDPLSYRLSDDDAPPIRVTLWYVLKRITSALDWLSGSATRYKLTSQMPYKPEFHLSHKPKQPCECTDLSLCKTHSKTHRIARPHTDGHPLKRTKRMFSESHCIKE
jgi:hypothetical protein